MALRFALQNISRKTFQRTFVTCSNAPETTHVNDNSVSNIIQDAKHLSDQTLELVALVSMVRLRMVDLMFTNCHHSMKMSPCLITGRFLAHSWLYLNIFIGPEATIHLQWSIFPYNYSA